jgi:RNA polymerase sigma-70 factor (ECF subfamily)
VIGSEKNKAKREFEEACLAHIDALYASALKLTRSPADADELVQDTFLKAFRFAHKFEWGTNLKAWLFRIQSNTFINDYRHRGHERKYFERAATESIYDQVLDSEAKAYASNPETHVFNAFLKQELDRAVESLPDDFKIVVLLTDVQGFSYKEVADIIGCPIGTVMSRLHRGRRILQRELVDFAVDAGISTKDNKDNTDIKDTKETKEVPSDLSNFRNRKKSEGLLP